MSLTVTGDWFSNCEDISMAYHQFTDPDDVLPSGIVPLMERLRHVDADRLPNGRRPDVGLGSQPVLYPACTCTDRTIACVVAHRLVAR
ncbi:hypothetical protein [Streptomyces sp. SD31]|uniref:hypothetical protein n=1 Tax=Streptomyces sp. SD31 TaxID=3452208 RepID=UPI003F8CC368